MNTERNAPKAIDQDATTLVSALVGLLKDGEQGLAKKIARDALMTNYLAGARSALDWRIRHIELSTCMSGYERVAIAGNAIRDSMESAVKLPNETLVAKMDHPGNGEIIH